MNDAGSGNTAGEFKIAAVTPEADAMLEALDSNLEVTFSADVDPKTLTAQSIQVLFSDFMDSTTITNATFQLFDSTAVAVPAKVVAPREPAPGKGHDGGHKLSLRAAGEVLQPGSDHAVLTPLAELKLNTKYTAKLANTTRSL